MTSARPRPRRCWAWRYRRVLFLVALTSFSAVSGTAYLLVRVPLPPERPQAETTLITDATGARLASLDAGENRVVVALRQVPDVVVKAVLAAEDKAFFNHSGLDPVGILRATWADVRGKQLQGGSTITQQYVKNVYLGPERTLWRKLREAVLAVKIERRFQKDEILEKYLNTIYLGRGSYGVQAAAQAYFAKDVEQLGLREAAYLAGLIRAPEMGDAARTSVVAAARRTRVLQLMERAGFVTTAQRRAVEAEPAASYVVAREKAQSTFAMPEKGTQYFVEYVRRQLLERYDPATVYRGGLRVRTTLDLRLHAQAYDAVYGVLDRPDDPAGALVAVDAGGHIKAMVGGRDWNAQVPYAKVNLAVGREGGGTGRQPGSTFKPFVLAALVKEGFSVRSAFPGPAKVTFPRADQGRDYEVENFEDTDFGEGVSLVDATRHSVNTVYAQAIKALGPAKAARLARAAGISSPLVENISLALGTSEVSVLEMATAYNTFATRGVHVEPTAILDVRTAEGRLLQPARPPARTRVLDPAHADVVTACLRQVVERGSGTAAAFGRPAAGKTGTTQDFADAWFVGYTPRLTAAVWMGYPEGNRRKMTDVHGREVHGGSFPAVAFRRFMQAAARVVPDLGTFQNVSNFPGRTLAPPGNVVLGTTTTTTATTAPSRPAPASMPPAPSPSAKPAQPPPAPTTTATAAAGPAAPGPAPPLDPPRGRGPD